MNKNFKLTITFISIGLVGILMWSCKPIWYGLKQGKGQLNVVWKAKPIDHYLENPEYPDSLKEKLRVVENIKKFAYDSLGLVKTKSYQKLFDQEGKPAMYVVTGSEPYQLKSYEWHFPFWGSFSYKGHFKLKSAKREEQKLIDKGYDADIGEVNAWSTLGWFKDPVMSGMLEKDVGQLSRILIHEITHGTLFVKNDIEFNENLATFVGDQGAILFLKHEYGANSKALKSYLKFWEDMEIFTDFMKKNAIKLEKFYIELNKVYPDESKVKQQLKKDKIKALMKGVHQLSLNEPERFTKFYDKADQLNNTFFTDFLNYRSSLKVFEKELREKFNGNFHKYLAYLKEKYG